MIEVRVVEQQCCYGQNELLLRIQLAFNGDREISVYSDDFCETLVILEEVETTGNAL